jgi:hypothetical protein
MIYVHHVPKRPAADELSRAVAASLGDAEDYARSLSHAKSLTAAATPS